MKILIVTPIYIPNIGGIENHVKELSVQLKLRGHQIVIFVINTFYKTQKSQILGIDTYYIKARGVYPFIYFSDLRNFVDLENFDIIHIHDPHLAGISLHFYFKDYHKPKILSSHGGIFHLKKNLFLKKLYWNTLAKFLAKQYSKIICVSKHDYTNFKIITDNLVIVENGINIEKFYPCKRISPREKNFIYFGRFSVNKGIDNLLEVFRILFVKDNEIKLTLIGEINDSKIKDMIYRIKLEFPENIYIFPFLEEEDLIRLLCQHKFFVSATKYEGFGISIIEAIASGRIGIINNIPPLNQIFNESEVFFVEFEQKQETAHKILEIISMEEETLAILKRKGIRKANKYSWDNIIPKIENIYKEVI